MKLIPLFAFLLTPLSAVAVADLDTFVAELNKIGLTTFAGFLPSIAKTATGTSLINQLTTSTNFSIFAPTNDALKNMEKLDNFDALATTISYHTVHRNYYNSADKSLSAETLPRMTVARSLLDDTELVQLNGQGQMLTWGRDEGTTGKPVNITSTTEKTTVQGAYLIQGYGVFPVDHRFTIPPWLSIILRNKRFYAKGTTSTFASFLNSTYTDLPDGKNKTVLQYYSDKYVSGVTIFAPNNEAFEKVANQVATLKPEALLKVLNNHVCRLPLVLYRTHAENSKNLWIVAGTALYSNSLTPSDAVSGQRVTFVTDSSGTTVTSGGATGKITQANLIMRNGVVHVIDTVLTDFKV